MKIRGIEGLTVSEIKHELDRGGRFVVFQYVISVLVMTFRRSSPVFFLREGESAGRAALPYTLLTLILGWWGIPWGPIYTIGALSNNFRGGKDVTEQIRNRINLFDLTRKLGQDEVILEQD